LPAKTPGCVRCLCTRGEPIENWAQDAAISDWSPGKVADPDPQPFRKCCGFGFIESGSGYRSNPDPGFDDKKFKKKAENCFYIFLDQKLQFTYP
jgi:hypothetical protein